MLQIPQDAEKAQVDGATVDFLRFKLNEDVYYAFDTSMCGPPEPMVNAMAGLKLITEPGVKLLMINHKMPNGLLEKLGEDFEVEKGERDGGLVEVIFSFKGSVDMSTPKYCSTCH